ncbi:hypothetical protein [Cylindrospermopsis curvispora]|uniref:Uncharacterized protein n=1 Tax=Cylindrospermopsis curvispora GIHE-G1 TaxID=2666332 RepID=A0A7H0EWL9_9CYAN|nr:hypothetical protein [Cylindrospermopsis curvispora]QNP28185.1 hypothetical protein IAR63_09505 [Cylindrospermopsis curvispora GIHE-G1]
MSIFDMDLERGSLHLSFSSDRTRIFKENAIAHPKSSPFRSWQLYYIIVGTL